MKRQPILNTDLIIEALEDYRRWFDGDDESDIEKRRSIDLAIQQVREVKQ
jgi:hypothetical protein